MRSVISQRNVLTKLLNWDRGSSAHPLLHH